MTTCYNQGWGRASLKAQHTEPRSSRATVAEHTFAPLSTRNRKLSVQFAKAHTAQPDWKTTPGVMLMTQFGVKNKEHSSFLPGTNRSRCCWYISPATARQSIVADHGVLKHEGGFTVLIGPTAPLWCTEWGLGSRTGSWQICSSYVMLSCEYDDVSVFLLYLCSSSKVYLIICHNSVIMTFFSRFWKYCK